MGPKKKFQREYSVLKIHVARTFKEGIISHINCFRYFLFFSSLQGGGRREGSDGICYCTAVISYQ